jgi:hypothetical protein
VGRPSLARNLGYVRLGGQPPPELTGGMRRLLPGAAYLGHAVAAEIPDPDVGSVKGCPPGLLPTANVPISEPLLASNLLTVPPL